MYFNFVLDKQVYHFISNSNGPHCTTELSWCTPSSVSGIVDGHRPCTTCVLLVFEKGEQTEVRSEFELGCGTPALRTERDSKGGWAL